MTPAAPSWEQGSDFHHVSEYAAPSPAPAPWGAEGLHYYAGRPALNALLAWLERLGRARRVWLPAYYCDQVVYPLLERGLACRYYDGDPASGWDLPVPQLGPDDVLIVNSSFGMTLPDWTGLNALRPGVTVVEDHSQDPYSALAWSSQADYCFASLRKTLPLPDGGVLWSPAGHPLPLPPEGRPPVSTARVAAMLAKRAYLRGEFADKSAFRAWYLEAEQALDRAGDWGMSAYSLATLRALDVPAWRAARARNHGVIRRHLQHPRLTLLHAERSEDSPMGVVVLAERPAQRDALRAWLIGQQIYPATLWPLVNGMHEAATVRARHFADRMLFLHCDGRYGPEDMRRVAERLSAWAVDA